MQPAATVPASSLADALLAFLRATRRARGRAAAQPSPNGVSLAQYHLLEPLLSGPRPVGQLAEASGLAPPTATRMLDTLARRRFVERAADPDDRRAVVVSLTPGGRRATEGKQAEVRAALRRIAGSLDPDERARAAELLVKLTMAVEAL